MRMIAEFLRRHSLVTGIALMFLLTWPIDLANAGILPIHLPFVVYLFLGWGFIIAAVVMTWLSLGENAVWALLRRCLKWRVGWKWYLVPLLIPAVMGLGVALYSLLTGNAPDFSQVYARKIFGASPSLALFILPFFLVDLISNGEEVGWRGYVLPRFQAKHGALVSAVMLGVIWGFWHLPKFLNHWDTLVFSVLMLDTIAKSILQAWLYNNTRGSLLLVMLTHAAYNTAGVFLPIANTLSNANSGTTALIAVLELVTAVMVTVMARPAQLSLGKPKQAQA